MIRMRGRVNYVICILLAINVHANAQRTDSRLKLSWMSFSFELGANTNLPSDTTTYQELSKTDDTLLHPGLNGFQQKNYYYPNIGGGMKFAAGFHLPNKKDRSGFISRKILRLGLSYNFYQFLSAEYAQTSSVRYDTVTDQGATLYFDSIYTKKFKFRNYHQLVGFEAALLFQTDTSKLLGFYGGFSYTQYFGLGNAVVVEYDHQYELQQSNPSGQVLDKNPKQHNLFSDASYLRGKASLTSRFAVPLALSFRLARTTPIIRNMQLFGEVMPCLDLVVYPGVRTYISAGANWQGGMRYYIR
jgi:hypothetical protein